MRRVVIESPFASANGRVTPESRLKTALAVPTASLPIPDDEAVAHSLFDVATESMEMPPNSRALSALIDKYVVGKIQ
jgi:hypothetical protein